MAVDVWLAVVGWLCLSGLWLFALMARDKRAAQTRRRRIPERRLLLWAWLGGAWGGWLSMLLLRHKTRHMRFRIVVPLAAMLWLVLVAWLRMRASA